MRRVLSYLNSPYGMMTVGGLLFLAGELRGAIWDGNKPGGTFSEWYKSLPPWVKQALNVVAGYVLSHLHEWRIRDIVEEETR